MDKIRTLGLYQPYAQLMLHGKLESRWIAKGKKAPFPLGQYLLYATKKAYSAREFAHLNSQGYERAMKLIKPPPPTGPTITVYGRILMDDDIIRRLPNGMAIGTGALIEVKPITSFTELEEAYFWPRISELSYRDADHPEFVIDGHVLWGLRFENMRRIKPFPFKGKQGVGFLSEEDYFKIKYI